MKLSRTSTRCLAILAAGTFLAAAPVSVTYGPDAGFALGASKAFAKDGRDDSGGDDHGGGKGGGGKGGGGGSGSGKSGGRDDSSGSGKGGSGKSDDGGKSGKSDDGGKNGKSDDGGRSGRGSDDDGADDDHGGRGRGGDDPAGDDRGGRRGDAATRGGAAGGTAARGLQVTKFEQGSGGLEVVYSNGVKEEIEGGRYELKNPAGRTLVERAATQRDLARINANVSASGIVPGTGPVAVAPQGSQARKVEVSGSAVEVVYDTGWKEEIENGRYELKDPNNNTVVQRRATSADRDRMLALAGS
jgi:hypothetical protein